MNYFKVSIIVLLALVYTRFVFGQSEDLDFEVHFDKPFYASGDSIKLSAFALKEISDYCKLINVSLIAGSSVVASENLKLHGVNSSGYIAIPDSLSSGIYEIQLHYQKGRLNNFQILPIYVLNLMDLNKQQTIEAKHDSVCFYPEGGLLLQGVPNKVFIKYIMSSNQLIVRNAILVDENGSIISSVKNFSNGTGFFEFIPIPEKQYFLQVINNNEGTLVRLPAIKKEGIKLYFDQDADKYAIVSTLKNTSRFQLKVNDVVKEETLYVENIDMQGIHRKEINWNAKETMSTLYAVELLDSANSIVSSICGLNDYLHLSNGAISISIAKDTYSSGAIVDLSVNNQEQSPFSLSVQNEEVYGFTSPEKENFFYILNRYPSLKYEILLLGSVFKDKTMWNEYLKAYAFSIDSRRLSSSLLKVQEDLPGYDKCKNLSISGQLLGEDTGLKRNILVTQVSVENSALINYSYTDNEAAIFRFDDLDIEGDDYLILKTAMEDSGIKMVYNLDLNKKYIPQNSHDTHVPDKNQTNLATLYKIKVSNSLHLVNDFDMVDSAMSIIVKPSSVGNLANDRIHLKEYDELSNMEEVIKEVLPFVKLNKKKGFVRVNVFSQTMKTTLEGEPIFIIDGVPYFNSKEFLNLSPSAIETIEVYREPENLKKLDWIGRFGVVKVYTKSGVHVPGNVQLLFKFPFKGYQQAKSFGYLKENAPSPYFVDVLFWKPFVNEPDLNFVMSDDVANFNVVVNGIDKQGNKFSVVKQVKVRQAWTK